MGNCLRQPGLFRNHPKVYARKIKAPYQTFGIMTTPTTETKSIGLPADALVVMVFASPSGQFYRDVTNPAHLPGLCKNACQP
jgi:hypothetical protein